MANQYLTSSLVTREAVALFKALNSFVSTGYKGDYAQDYANKTYKSGDTINVRQDNFFVGERGDAITGEDIVEQSFPLTIGPLYSVAIAYTPTDLQRKIASFSDEILKPAVRRLVAMMNTDIANNSLSQVNYYVGDRTAFINSFAAVNQANPVLDNLNANLYDRYFVLDPTNAAQLQNSLQNTFVTPLNKDITYDARVTRLADFDVMKDNSISPFTAGTHTAAGDITVNAAVASGSTIVVAGLTAGATFKVGDSFSITGVKAFDRVNRVPLATDMQFVVTAAVTAAGATQALTISPALVADGPRQNFYVAGASPNEIPAGAVVSFVGNNVTYVNEVAYTQRGLIVVIPPLQPMDSPYSSVFTDPTYGVSLRISKTAEVLNNKNIMRLDAQMATSWVPDQAVRVLAKAS